MEDLLEASPHQYLLDHRRNNIDKTISKEDISKATARMDLQGEMGRIRVETTQVREYSREIVSFVGVLVTGHLIAHRKVACRPC